MTDSELLWIVEFVDKTRRWFRRSMPIADSDAALNIFAHLIRCEISGRTVTISELTRISELPYTTARRHIDRMVGEGYIVRRPRSRTAKSYSVHPSPKAMDAFGDYALKIKAILVQTLGSEFAGPSMPMNDGGRRSRQVH